MLHGDSGKPITIGDGKLIHDISPFLGPASPIGRDVAQRQPPGGRSAAGFLRLMGKDTFLLTSDVVARLKQAGVIEREPTGQRDLQRVQDALNALQQASGRPLCQLSAMLALSIHPMF